MMHHPNMHHQAMSGHPAQHIGGHQGMPSHHQMPPHQMHRDNRHVLPRVAMGPSQGGGMGAHGQPMGGMGAAMGGMGVGHHHAPSQRPPHAIRAMHHAPSQHHSMPPQMKQMRRGYAHSGYAHGMHTGPLVYGPQPPHIPPPASVAPITGVSTASTNPPANNGPAAGEGAADGGGSGCETSGPGDAEAARPASSVANSKEKTPMCLVNELARYNKIKHQYRLTSETGPAHKKVFTVTLRLGETEEYTSEGSSIKRAQHAAASAALTQTRHPAPPPRHHPPHTATSQHRHTGTVMPTVELNALAMKLCEPAIYTTIPPVPAPTRLPRMPRPMPRLPIVPGYNQRMLAPSLMYRVKVTVGGRGWAGTGPTPQAARHDAAARALHDLRQMETVAPLTNCASVPSSEPDAVGEVAVENGADILSSEVKSPVSLVHELALKRNLSVGFSVKSERGPPHMRVFITACTVGDMETEGEGNGKKVSKRRAAEKMLDEMRLRWPPALLRARPPPQAKRKQQPAKKKPRNLIKESGEPAVDPNGDAADNPISRLAMARHAHRARSPQYRVLEERGAARRREFVVQCDAPPHRATGTGPNKKTAKRRAAHNVLLAMELSGTAIPTDSANPPTGAGETNNNDASKTNSDLKRKDGDVTSGGDLRQPVPGVLLMDYNTHQRSGQPPAPNGVSETCATGGAGSPGAKEQLLYLSQLLGFSVQFSDFPKRNHGEFLSLVSLSTEPPVMCHGGGASTALSHEQCARNALRALTQMGLDAPATGIASLPTAGSKVLSNGITE